MNKFLGVGFVFSAIDKGLNKFLDKANNSVRDLEEGAEKAGDVKPAKGSFWDAISEISKIGLLSSIADGIQDTTDKATELTSTLGGKGLGESFKTLDKFATSYANRLGGAAMSSKEIQNLASDISRESRIGLEAAGELLQVFDKQGLALKGNEQSLKFLGQVQKITNADAVALGGTYATLTKNLGMSGQAAQGLFEQISLLEARSGKEGLVAELPNIVNELRQASEQGLIPRGAIDDVSKRLLTFRAGLQNTGMSTEDAQAATDEYLQSILGVRKAFVEAQFGAGDIAQIAEDFGFAGQNVGALNDAVKRGDVTAFLSGLTDATAGLPADKIQDFTALLSNKFGPGVATTFANFRKKGFQEINNLANDITRLDATSRAGQFGEVYNNMIQSIQEKEEELQASSERFSKLIDTEIQESNRNFLEAQIEFNDELAKRVRDGTTTVFDDAIVGIKKFQKGGLMPFAKGISDAVSSIGIFGDVTEKDIGQSIAALNVFTPIIKDSADEVFFFTGALANIAKIAPSPFEMFGKLGEGASAVGDKFRKMGGISGMLPKVMGMASKAMRGVGIALRFMTGPIGLIITGVAALGAGLVYAYKNSETFRGIIDGAWETMKGWGETLYQFGAKLLPPVWEGIKSAAEFTIKWLNPIGLIYNGFKKLMDLFPNFGKFVMKYVSQPFDDVTTWFKESTVGKIFNELTGGDEVAKPKKVSVAQATAPKTQPETVAARSIMPTQDSMASSGTAFSGNPTQTTSQSIAARNPNSEQSQMVSLFAQVGNEIVSAIREGQQNVTIQLKGDARKLFAAQGNMISNKAATRGVALGS